MQTYGFEKNPLRAVLKLVPWFSAMFWLTFSTVSHAGRDASELMMQNRSNEAAALEHSRAHQAMSASSPNNEPLPLDHGPHAVTTPWLNEQHKLGTATNQTPSAPPPDSTLQKHAH